MLSDIKNVAGQCRLCVAGLTDFSHIVCCMVIDSFMGLLLVFNALFFTQIIQKQVEKGEFLSNAEVLNPKK